MVKNQRCIWKVTQEFVKVLVSLCCSGLPVTVSHCMLWLCQQQKSVQMGESRVCGDGALGVRNEVVLF